MAKIPLADEWIARGKDVIFTNVKDVIICDVLHALNVQDVKIEDTRINYFWVRPKKSYNSDLLRNHTCTYINYFERWFDPELEYYTNLSYIKFMIDCVPDYNKDNFLYDINRYIIHTPLFDKVMKMVDHNYSLTLNYKNTNNQQLQYTNDHAKALMTVSIMMNMCIPLITHFAYIRNMSYIDDFLLDVYDNILYAPQFQGNVDIIAKLFETTVSNVSKNARNNAAIWASSKQDIRGKNIITHSKSAERNIILNIIPKYTFSQNMISLNYTSIQKSNKFQITDIQYEYSYVSLSSSKREGEDSTSDFDKFESNLTKADESKFLQNKFNYEYTMEQIIRQWGPFDPDELAFFKKELKNENGELINNFQKQLVFNLFYKYFGDTVSIKAINEDDYVMLILAAKKMLKNNMMGYLPYVLSGKVQKIVTRKILNKKELMEMQSSQYYQLVVDKFKNEKIINQILGTIATIITSSFTIIDYDNPEIHGKPLHIESKIIIEETLLYILLI